MAEGWPETVAPRPPLATSPQRLGKTPLWGGRTTAVLRPSALCFLQQQRYLAAARSGDATPAHPSPCCAPALRAACSGQACHLQGEATRRAGAFYIPIETLNSHSTELRGKAPTPFVSLLKLCSLTSNSSPPVLIVTMIPFGCIALGSNGRCPFPDVYRVIAQQVGAFPLFFACLSSLHL